ncbi:MAG: hypothetical protein JNK48_11045 [Bryobacterales bacterium]|nr:hypothetical protein [Bryobacterales bacterium]
MFGTVIIGANAPRLRWMQELALESRKLLLVRTFDRYPTIEEASRQFGPLAPTLVLLDMEERDYALAAARAIHTASPGTAIIACQKSNPVEHYNVSETGIVVAIPFEAEVLHLERAIADAVHLVKNSVQPHLVSFLPAKAGSGCSTVVMNTAIALARSFDKNVLVIEGDLRSGVLSSALSCPRRGCIQQSLLSAHEMDAFRWNRFITEHAGVDWLLSDRSLPPSPPDWSNYYAILQFALPRYDCVLVDLPELVNPGTAEIVRSSGRVYVATTQEMVSLTLANQRFADLSSWGISADRIGVLLNRLDNRIPTRADVERLLQHPVSAVFPNDYPACQRAISDGTPPPTDTPLGIAFTQFAAQLLGTTAIVPRPRQRFLSKLLHNFSSGYASQS